MTLTFDLLISKWYREIRTGIFIWGLKPRDSGMEVPQSSGSRGEARVGDGDFVLQKLKQFANIVYRF